MKLKILFYFLTVSLFTQCSSSPNEKEMATEDENKNEKDSCCTNHEKSTSGNVVMESEITCPNCGHKKMEVMPTDVCRIKYDCEKCDYEMYPKEGDCCVFCTYGTHKCPSMQ